MCLYSGLVSCNLQSTNSITSHLYDPLCLQVNKTTSGRFVISLNNNQQEYCGYVYYKTLSEWGRSDSQNASFCATLPGEENADHNLFFTHNSTQYIEKFISGE